MRYSIFLKENYEIFVQMFDKMKSEILIIDDRNRVIIANYAMCRRAGVLRKDLEGMKVKDLAEKYGIITSAAIEAIFSDEERCSIVRGNFGECRIISCIPLFYRGAVDIVIYINKNVKELDEAENASKKDIAAQNDKYRQKMLKQSRKNRCMEEPVYDITLCLGDMLEQYEKQILLHVLEECGTMTAAANRLKVNKSTVSRKIKKHDIKL